ncbi:hypothetical protein GPJ56_000776 [Histomonas meleagridis]|uniref:uncharacterized protein n=1 Tax=Histomonas meleagridis TaxID=135588 RepID=UPI00355A901E|nr:hypothetical protein GPJ56_000776 [Histomonas meleagridis]KAH0804465.1 hypothetical protein GO595_003295 [Histomonas meleagridis]
MGCLLSCCKPSGYEKLSENPKNNKPRSDEFHADDLGVPNMDEINDILDQSDGDVNLSDAELEMYLEKLQTE